MLEKFALYRILNVLIESPQSSSLRELAKKADTSVSRAKYCIDWLEEKNVVKKNEIGRNHQYSLNMDNLVSRQMKILFSVSEIQESGIIDELVKNFPEIISIVLYGSTARGENDGKSDIDLLIVSTREIKLKPLKSEEKFKKEVTLTKYTNSEWREKSKKDKVFYDRVIIEGIALYGEKPVMA